MARKGKQFLFESFEDRKMAMLVGFLCLVYLVLSNLPGAEQWAGTVLPPWSLEIFVPAVFVTLLGQAIVWKLFRHFEDEVYKEPIAWLLFCCEYGLVLFSVTFVSWPIYLFYSYLTSSRPGA